MCFSRQIWQRKPTTYGSIINKAGELTTEFPAKAGKRIACLVIDNPILHKYGLDKYDGLGPIIGFCISGLHPRPF
ncbi:hypothetical protein SBDP2_1950004 [Syntrophobacter sp. SbD2]|nr:hypothetical protein SBDP2_1950004 [Syntrophobacter sp. SbD2]